MKKQKYKLLSKLLLILLFEGSSVFSQGQTNYNYSLNDTLTLDKAIKEVIQNHPSIKETEESINEAGNRINLAKTGYYPKLDFDASFTRLGPISSISIPMLGSFDLYPANNYEAELTISENIFDFGKTSSNIDYQKQNQNISEQKLVQVKQSLASSTINCFFNITYIQEAIKIKDEQLTDLQQHLDFVNRKKESGSAIKYEILTTQVRISTVQSQKIDLESYLQIQQSQLNSLLGKPVNCGNYLMEDTILPSIGIQNDSLISYAINHRVEMEIAREKSTLAELNYSVVKSQNYPSINIFASGGWKNGYFPDLKTFTPNYAAGIRVFLPIFDFGRNKNNLLIANSSVLENNFEIDNVKRKIEYEVTEVIENATAAQKKLGQFELQLSQSREAYSLAEINFKDGAITNLDLLDASTNVSESRLLLLKAKIDYILSLYKLKSSLGMRLY